MVQNWKPLPAVNFRDIVSDNVIPPLQLARSGEITASVTASVIGASRFAGSVKDVWMSVVASGKDDSNALQISGEVFINGVTCLSTKPSIAHVSGEASTNKTTVVTGDTGIAQAVIDYSANSFVAGDVFTANLTLVRSSTPTTEMSSVVVVVELDPA